MISTPKAVSPPKIERVSVRDWLKGTVSAFDDGRTPTDGLRNSGNVILEQDGTIRPRPSLILYGTQPSGTVLGEIFECVRTVGATVQNYLVIMQNVGGVAQVYTSKDGGAWTVATGKTYDLTARAHFCQIDEKVLVMNGVDNLSYLDLSTLTVTPFTALTTPATPTLTTNTGLTGSTTNIYYRVSANSTVGETIASTALTVPVSTDRDLWTPATQKLTIGWTAVTNARSYNVYMGTVSGSEFLLAAGINGLSYIDDGTAHIDPTRQAPVSDSTAGPKTSRGTVINGQVFMTGDKDNPRYIWFGGYGKSVLDFSPFNGGGNIEIGRGSKEFPVRVMPFRDNKGTPTVTVLCKGTNGRGKRYIMSHNSTTYGSTLVDFWDVVEDNGQDSTDSPDAVVLYRDSLWYPSRDGFKTTGTKPQLQNLLSTSTVSETIITDIKNLNTGAMDKAVGLAYEGRIYFSLPVSSTTNNEIWVLDLERKGAWMKPWNIAADWLSLYNDNNGMTHFLVLSGNKIYEFSYQQLTSDNGVPVPTSASSGLIKFSDDGLEWAKIIKATFFLQRPQGSINLTIAGKTEDESLVTLGQLTSVTTADGSVVGWSEAGWGGFGWSNPPEIPVAYSESSKPVEIEIDEEVQWWTWGLDSAGLGVDYQLSDVVIEFVRIGLKDLN